MAKHLKILLNGLITAVAGAIAIFAFMKWTDQGWFIEEDGPSILQQDKIRANRRDGLRGILKKHPKAICALDFRVVKLPGTYIVRFVPPELSQAGLPLLALPMTDAHERAEIASWQPPTGMLQRVWKSSRKFHPLEKPGFVGLVALSQGKGGMSANLLAWGDWGDEPDSFQAICEGEGRL